MEKYEIVDAGPKIKNISQAPCAQQTLKEMMEETSTQNPGNLTIKYL